MPTKIENHHYLMVKFFGASDSRVDDVNPYDSVGVFRRSTIESLRFGATPETIAASKKRLAKRLHDVLKLDQVMLPVADIEKGLNRSSEIIDNVVFTWAGKMTVKE